MYVYIFFEMQEFSLSLSLMNGFNHGRIFITILQYLDNFHLDQ